MSACFFLLCFFKIIHKRLGSYTENYKFAFSCTSRGVMLHLDCVFIKYLSCTSLSSVCVKKGNDRCLASRQLHKRLEAIIAKFSSSLEKNLARFQTAAMFDTRETSKHAHMTQRPQLILHVKSVKQVLNVYSMNNIYLLRQSFIFKPNIIDLHINYFIYLFICKQ